MKKRVRVYKPGGEAQQPTQEQIIGYIAQRMQSDDFDGDTEALKEELASAGIDNDSADQYITYVSDNLDLDNADDSDTEEQQALLEQQQAAEEAAYRAQQEAMYNTDTETETDDTTDESYMREGGSKLSKSRFIKQYTKFAKMAQGGNTPAPGPDDVLNGREAHVKGFLGAVKNTANEAMLREEAENQYNDVYGTPQVGAFQEGGIHQEEVDFENPLHHLSTYGTDTRHIFSDDMYTQNDVAAMEQFGGNTGQGLYKFIGGGDNESADEEYQDADIDFNQEEYQMGGFRMPRRSGRQYTQAVGSPYYTATGEAANPVYLANRKVTSVDVTKRGIFGRPKAYTVNYDGTTSATPATTPATTPTGEYTPPNEFTGDRQPIANWMMRTGIPGVRGLGAKMIDSKQLPDYDVKKNDPDEIARVKRFHPGYQPFSQNEEQVTKTYDDPPFTEEQQKYLTQSLRIPEKTLPVAPPVYNGTIPLNTAGPVNTNFTDFENQKQIDQAKKIEALAAGNTNSNSSDEQTHQDFLIRKQMHQDHLNRLNQPAHKAYGGPIDYTEYAYGGDISVPELYRAQTGMQTNAFDPNANPLGLNKKDYKGDTVDFTGKVIKKRNPNFSFDNTATDITVPGTVDKNYTNPLTGEKPAITAGSDGKYVDNTASDLTVDPKAKQGTSEDYVNKKNWNKTRKNFNTGLMAVNAGLDIFDQVTANRQQNQMLEDITSAESNYGISNQDDRGDYDPNSGLFRPDQTGFKGVAEYGGIYATGGSTEEDDEDVQYMTQEEIDDFIANGGELEYL